MTNRLPPSILNPPANREFTVAYKAEFDLQANPIIVFEALARCGYAPSCWSERVIRSKSLAGKA